MRKTKSSERGWKPEEKLRPILAGEVDTLVIDGPDGHRIYTLQGLDAESNRFRGEMLAQVSDDGLLLLGKDWRCTYCNEQGARMIGRSVEQLLGQCVWDLFPHAVGTNFEACYRRAMESGQPVHFEEFYPEPLNLWLECSCYPSNEGLSVYFRDVTQRKRVEAALQQNAALFATLIEQAPMGVYVVDGQFRLQQVNTEAMPTFETVRPLIGAIFL